METSLFWKSLQTRKKKNNTENPDEQEEEKGLDEDRQRER